MESAAFIWLVITVTATQQFINVLQVHCLGLSLGSSLVLNNEVFLVVVERMTRPCGRFIGLSIEVFIASQRTNGNDGKAITLWQQYVTKIYALQGLVLIMGQ